MEETRQYRVTIEIYRDTNKDTYIDRHDFETPEAAHEWLTESLVEETADEAKLRKIREQLGVADGPDWVEEVLEHIAELQARVYLTGPKPAPNLTSQGALKMASGAGFIGLAEAERLRARDEAAKAVVQAWAHYRALPVRGDLAAALDALTRAHEDE